MFEAILANIVPILLGGGSAGGLVMAAWPFAKRILARFDTTTAGMMDDSHGKLVSSIFGIGEHVFDYIKAKGATGNTDGGASIGVELIEALFGPRLDAVGIDKAALEKIVLALIGKFKTATPPTAA